MGAVVDVAECTAIEEALGESQRLFRTIVDTSHEGIWVLDSNSRVTYVNQRMAEILGYSPQEMRGRLASDFVPQELRQAARRNMDRRRAGVTEQFDFPLLHKDGSEIWASISATPMMDEEGRFVAALGMVSDITDRKRVEGRLRESKEEYQDLYDNAPDMMASVDASTGNLLNCNRTLAQVLGYAKEEIVGQPMFFLYPSSCKEDVQKVFQSFVKTGEVHDAELQLKRKDESTIDVCINVSAVRDEEGRVLYSRAIYRDITEQKQLERQLTQAQKMEAVGQLTGGIAHDFNNLLTIVIGNLQLLEDSLEENEELCRPIHAALDAGMRGAELTRRLLAFARQQLLTPKVLNINGLATGIEPLLHRTLGEDVRISTKPADDLWLTTVDPSQLENALVNLAINARDAMPNGGKLTIETSNTSLDESYAVHHAEVLPGEYVLLTVSDNGTGISDETLPHVFDPFFSTKELGKGSGLGLSMVYGFVKQSEGHLKIYSEEGHGTTVKIYLPRAQPAANRLSQSTTRRARIPGGHETILLVEDDVAVREIARTLLKGLGYQLLEADTGSAALEVLDKSEDIDLLFTDIVMPGGMTGTELALCARERRPSLKVLYTTGYTDSAILDNGLVKCPGAILNKPYRKEDLAKKIRGVLDEE